MKAQELIKAALPEAENFKPGDVVSFQGRRGKQVTGTVARVRVKERRKASAFLAAHGLPAPHIQDITQTMVAEVIPAEGGGTWTVPFRMLKMVKPGGGDARQAQQTMYQVRQSYQDHLRQRRSSRFDAADQGGLSGLKPGDKVKCQFRGGDWRERKFRRLTPSGKVEVENDYGRVEKHNPQFVKKSE